eukprot:PhM_4_TR12651/c0_g1_i1/m.11644
MFTNKSNVSRPIMVFQAIVVTVLIVSVLYLTFRTPGGGNFGGQGGETRFTSPMSTVVDAWVFELNLPKNYVVGHPGLYSLRSKLHRFLEEYVGRDMFFDMNRTFTEGRYDLLSWHLGDAVNVHVGLKDWLYTPVQQDVRMVEAESSAKIGLSELTLKVNEIPNLRSSWLRPSMDDVHLNQRIVNTIRCREAVFTYRAKYSPLPHGVNAKTTNFSYVRDFDRFFGDGTATWLHLPANSKTVFNKQGEAHETYWDVTFNLPADGVKGHVTYRAELLSHPEPVTVPTIRLKINRHGATIGKKLEMALLRARMLMRTLATAMQLDNDCNIPMGSNL